MICLLSAWPTHSRMDGEQWDGWNGWEAEGREDTGHHKNHSAKASVGHWLCLCEALQDFLPGVFHID